MKTHHYIVIAAWLLLLTWLAFAQTGAPPVAPGADHTSLNQLWVFTVAAITPLIIAGAKKVIPNVPSALIPCVAPVVGILLGLGLNALGAAHLAWVDMGIAGGLGVTIREIVDQNVLQRLKAAD